MTIDDKNRSTEVRCAAVDDAVVDADDVARQLAARRRRAHSKAVADVSGPGLRADQPVLGLRTYGQGRVVLALSGYFDQAAIARLVGAFGDLHRLGTEELLIDLSQLGTCPAALARILAQLRMQRLVHGARVEIHHPPAELTATLGDAAVDMFTITDSEHHDHDHDQL